MPYLIALKLSDDVTYVIIMAHSLNILRIICSYYQPSSPSFVGDQDSDPKLMSFLDAVISPINPGITIRHDNHKPRGLVPV